MDDGLGWRLPAPAKIGAVSVFSALALWLSLGVTLTLVMGRAQPTLALAVWPRGAVSNAALASQAARASNWEVARTAAEKALVREPVNVEAVRTLGLVAAAAQEEKRATRLFKYSESLSRRDAATQFWLIEESAARDDVRGALTHYDRALRVSAGTNDMLIPVLVQAVSDPAVAEPLAKILVKRPGWWSVFVEQMIAADGVSPQSMTFILKRLKLDPTGDYRWLLSRSISRLIDLGAYQSANELYRQARGNSTELLRDGNFTAANTLPPFDWMYPEQPGLSVVREVREGAPGGGALTIIADPARKGEVARQFLMLRPGKYGLGVVAGEMPEDASARPAMSVMCVKGRELVRIPMPATAASPVRLAATVTVPHGCEAQWVRIESGTGPDSSPDGWPWIGAVSLQAL